MPIHTQFPPNTSIYTGETTTIDSTQEAIIEIPIAEDEAKKIVAECVCIYAGERAAFHIEALFYRETGGNVMQEGNTIGIFESKSSSKIDFYFNADAAGNNIQVIVEGDDAATIKWVAKSEILRVAL